MRTLYNWTAKRAGGRITVYGQEDDGRAGTLPVVKVVGVDRIAIEGVPTQIIATVKDGEQVCLSTTAKARY